MKNRQTNANKTKKYNLDSSELIYIHIHFITFVADLQQFFRCFSAFKVMIAEKIQPKAI